jgi:hypothetical protein
MSKIKVNNKSDSKGVLSIRGESEFRKEYNSVVLDVTGDPEWNPEDWNNPDFDTSPKN